MKAIVLGSNGYIGKHIAWHLSQQGFKLALYDIQERNSLDFGLYIRINISEKEAVKSIDFDVDFVFFMTGLTGTFAAYDRYEQFIDVNEKGLLHVLSAMRTINSKARVVFPSTRLVYKGVKDTPLKEDAEKEFKSVYALNKWSGEQLLKQYADYFKINHTIVRICVPYGSSLGDTYSFGTVGFFLSKASKGEVINLYGDGDQKRTLTHVDDICLQVLSLITNDKSINEVFNISGETYSLRQLALTIADKFKTGVRFVDWPDLDLKMESGDTIFETSKINSLINYSNKYTVDKWIRNL